MGSDLSAQNRVSPSGDVISAPGRGRWMGNRGVLHRGDSSRTVVRNFRTTAWITCVLSFRDRRVPQWQRGRYTPLFFLDEAVALAAGHRPCAECRRTDFGSFRAAWAVSAGGTLPSAPEMDVVLHRERTGRDVAVMPTWEWSELPDGAFVLLDDGPAAVVEDRLLPWLRHSNCYGSPVTRPQPGVVRVLTPPATLGVLRTGYRAQCGPPG